MTQTTIDTGAIGYQLKRTYPKRKKEKKTKLKDAYDVTLEAIRKLAKEAT